MRNLSSSTKLVAASGFMICALLVASTYAGRAQSSGLLGTAESFAVLGGSTVTNTGPTVVGGNLGVSPGSAVTGFPPGIVIGVIHTADAVSGQAQSDVTTAYNSLAGRACDFDLTGQDLGGLTLIPGVYCFSSSAQLTGTLTLDAQGSSAATFIFQIGSTITTASNSSVLMINGGSPCNVYWQVGSSATLGTGTEFLGNILALTSITLNSGASVTGRALARNGAVTMDTNNVSAVGCGAVPELPTATAEVPTATVGVPATSTATNEAGATATATTVPGATATATNEAGATSTAPAPATTTPGTPGPIVPSPGTATPSVPISSTPTPGSPVPGTPTPIVPGTGTPASATPGTPTLGTPTPGTPTQGTPVPTTPTLVTTITSTPATSTPTTPTSTPVTVTPATRTPTAIWPTSTPTATRTAVTIVTFPRAGSGGMLSPAPNDQPVPLLNLAISIAIVMLLTGGLGVVVERRNSR